MGEFRGTGQIISAKQNQNIKEAMTGTSLILNIRRENRVIVLDEAETGNGHLQSSSKKRCHGNFCQQVLARA